MKRVGILLLAIILINLCLGIQLTPRVEVEASQLLVIGVQPSPPSFDIAKISDVPAYGVVEPSGCGYFKGKVKVRFDMFMTPDAPYYDRHYVFVVDSDSPEAQAGYSGEVDEETGEPLDWADYQKWVDGLPHIWVNTPFHSHFVYFNTSVSDDVIKAKIVEVTEYFWAFHKYCWDNDKQFIEEWKRVPRQTGTIRDIFIIGFEGEGACIAKADDITLRTEEFDTRVFEIGGVEPVDLNIGEKGTIDVGAAAIDRASYLAEDYTWVTKFNPANETGTIDTAELWFDGDDTNGEDVSVASFYVVVGNTLSTRDYEDLGTIVKGSKQVETGLDMDCNSGDYIGITYTDGRVERDSTGGDDVWGLSGDYIPCTNEDFTFYDVDYAFSCYGTGGGCSPSIENDPGSWNVNGGNPVSESSEYSTGLTYFTITNNSGGAVDISIGGTDMAGGGYTWDLSDTATPGDMIYGLKSGLEGGDYTIIVKESTPYNTLVEDLADEGTQKWGLKIYTPTNFDDGNEKTGTITLTAVCV